MQHSHAMQQSWAFVGPSMAKMLYVNSSCEIMSPLTHETRLSAPQAGYIVEDGAYAVVVVVVVTAAVAKAVAVEVVVLHQR
jgi:hypothetical protein